MSYASFDINNLFTNRLYFLVFSKLAYIASFLKEKFSFLNIKTGLVYRLNNRLNGIFYATEGILKHVNDIHESVSKSQLESYYSTVYKALSTYRKIYAGFEKVYFFGCVETKELNDAILDNLYTIESKVRSKTFIDKRNCQDANLIIVASELSINAVSLK